MPRYAGIRCYFGLPGAGKTAALVHWALGEHRRGRTVFASAGLDLSFARTFRTVGDFIAIPPGSSIALDEAPLWLDARGWRDLPPEVLYRLTQARKFDIHLRYTAIDPSMVEVTLRRVTFTWVELRSFAGRLNRWRFAASPPGAAQLRSEPGPWHLTWMRREVLEAYDTRRPAELSAWRRGRTSERPSASERDQTVLASNGAGHLT